MAVLFGLLLPLLQAAAEVGPARGLELFQAGKYDEALPYFEQALELAEKRYGPNDPALAVELNNLAEVHRLLGQLDKAEALYIRAIALDEDAGRGDDPGLATSLNNLALTYRTQGRLEEAEGLYLRALALLEKTLGPSHPDVARALNNLGVLYRLEGEPERARPLHERAVAIAEATLGAGHPTTETLKRNLAAAGERPAPTTPATAPAAEAPGRSAVPPPPSATASEPLPAAGPVAAAAPAAPPPATAGGGYAVQLAAVPEPGQVASEWRRLSGRYPMLKELELQPPQTVEVPGKGTFYRVIAGSFASRAEADAVCARLRAAGGSCRLARP
jgi:tetratricopeptide (TPR) repeat protein